MTEIVLTNGDEILVKEPVDAIMHHLNRAIPVKGVSGPMRVAGYATVTIAAPALKAGKRLVVFKHAIATLEED